MATERGKTTRLILEALTWLSHGLDVVIVAFPAAEAFRIADEVSQRAQSFGIPCESNRGIERHGDAPLLMIRPFGWTPTEYPEWRPKPKVLQDHSACFERTSARPPALRTVMV